MLKAADGSVKNYERYYRLPNLNEEMVCRAKEMFEEYRARGVILCGNFGEDKWLITNQVRKTTLRFLPNEFLFRKYAENWIGCSYRCYVDRIKAYAVFNMDIFSSWLTL